MKIIHPSGEFYDLYPNTEVELTRYNPFFNDLGEQSIPVSIPATQKNLQLLGHPDRADNINKPDSRLNTQIQSGSFSVVGRQAILSAQAKGNIETSFYLHEGAFYEKTEDITLFEIFENKKLSFSTIDEAINFMYTLVPGTDPRFAVFSVMTDKYTLNMTKGTKTAEGYYRFVNETETNEKIDGKSVTIPAGFYITPFIKVKYVLQEVFNHLGYTMATSFLDQEPFTNMVFLNNNIDTIVNNSINYVDVVPDITVKTLFDVIRKFGVEFKPDEVNKEIYLVPFDEPLSSPPSVDLTPFAVTKPVVNYHNQYRQLKLTSEQISLPAEISILDAYGRSRDLSTGSSDEQGLDFISIFTKYPTSYLRQVDGYIVRDGVKGERTFVEKIAHLGISYYAGGILPVEEHSFPDVVPAMYTGSSLSPNGEYTYVATPYVGPGRALQSKVVFQDELNNDEVADSSQLKPILCLFYNVTTHCKGTIHNYNDSGVKLWNNSITWNGPDGLFEKFWRKRDTLMRNALLEIQVDTILPEEIKLTLSPVKQVMLHNQKYLISEINYSTERKSIGSCSLLSTKLQQPVSEAKPADEYFREKTYKWIARYTRSWTPPVGITSVYKYKIEPIAFYPEDPTSSQYSTGGKYFQRIYEVEYGTVDRDGNFSKVGDGTITTWLEPTLY